MARQYRLKRTPHDFLHDIDGAYDPYGDPNAPWRNDPATIRQLRRLEFFDVRYPSGLTKGGAADLIDAIEPTLAHLASYQAWKDAGEPNIKEWKRLNGRGGREAQNPRTGGGFPKGLIFFFGFLFAGGVFVASMLKPLFENRDSAPSVSPQESQLATPAPYRLPSPSSVAPPPSRADVGANEKLAVKMYPSLAVAGSPLNMEFLKRHAEYKQTRPEYFLAADWPVRLAAESAAALNENSNGLPSPRPQQQEMPP